MNRFFVTSLVAFLVPGCLSSEDPAPKTSSTTNSQHQSDILPATAPPRELPSSGQASPPTEAPLEAPLEAPVASSVAEPEDQSVTPSVTTTPSELNTSTMKEASQVADANWVQLRDADNQYTISVPKEWGPISAEALEAQGNAVSGPNMPVEYIGGYQLSAAEQFTHPFILVRKLPARLMPKSQIKEAHNLFTNSGDRIAKEVANRSNIDFTITPGVPVLDSETGIVWLTSELQGPNGIRVKCLVAHYYAGDSIFQFNAATLSTRSDEDWPTLKQIISTVKF